MEIIKKEYKNIGEAVHSALLPNGLKIKVVEKPGFNSCYAVLATDYGGAHRDFYLDGELKKTPAGVAHFLEHKMFDLPNGDNALELLSMNGADPNAFTSSDMTAYYFSCTDNFEDNLRLLLHFVTTPYFTEETVAKEQGIIAQEIMMGEDNPGVRLYYGFLSTLYRKHPVKDRIAGSVESISHITAQTLYDCHKAFYAPANMCLSVVGNVSAGRVVEIARETLGGEPAQAPRPVFEDEDSPLPYENFWRENMPVSAPQFLLGTKIGEVPKDGDTLRRRITAQLALRLLAGHSSPFYTRLYAQGLLTRDFDYELDYCAGTGTVILGGESQQPETVLKELCAEVERIGREGFDERRFELAKRASLGARLRGLEDFEGVGIAMVEGEFDGIDPFEAIPTLEKIKEKDCRDFVCTYFTKERLALAVIERGGENNE